MKRPSPERAVRTPGTPLRIGRHGRSAPQGMTCTASAPLSAWLILIALTLTACVPAHLGPTWIEPGTTPQPYGNILVFGVAAQPNIRRAYEDNFVAALGQREVAAMPGHRWVNERDLGRLSALRDGIQRSGADAVIITHLAVADADPGAGDTGGGAATPSHIDPERDARWTAYYNRILQLVTSPGYYSGSSALRLQTSLFDVRRAALVWSTRSPAFDPNSDTRISDIINDSLARMAQDGFLPRTVTAPTSPSPSVGAKADPASTPAGGIFER